MRQSRERGLKWKALVGHGAGYGVLDKLYKAVDDDANYIFNVDPASIWLIDPEALAPGLGEITEMVGEEYKKARPNTRTFSAHGGMVASNVFIFFDDVLPRAIKKHGGISSEALRKAAAETNIAVGGRLMGYGVKFEPISSDMAGQNNQAFPLVVQYTSGGTKIAWPRELQTTDPVLYLPKSSAFGSDNPKTLAKKKEQASQAFGLLNKRLKGCGKKMRA